MDVIMASFKDGSDGGCRRDHTDISEFGSSRGFELIASRYYASEEDLSKRSAVHLI